MNKNLKIILGTIYLISLGLILYAFFAYIDVNRITDYTYIRENTKVLIDMKNENFSFFILIFFHFFVLFGFYY